MTLAPLTMHSSPSGPLRTKIAIVPTVRIAEPRLNGRLLPAGSPVPIPYHSNADPVRSCSRSNSTAARSICSIYSMPATASPHPQMCRFPCASPGRSPSVTCPMSPPAYVPALPSRIRRRLMRAQGPAVSFVRLSHDLSLSSRAKSRDPALMKAVSHQGQITSLPWHDSERARLNAS